MCVNGVIFGLHKLDQEEIQREQLLGLPETPTPFPFGLNSTTFRSLPLHVQDDVGALQTNK